MRDFKLPSLRVLLLVPTLLIFFGFFSCKRDSGSTDARDPSFPALQCDFSVHVNVKAYDRSAMRDQHKSLLASFRASLEEDVGPLAGILENAAEQGKLCAFSKNGRSRHLIQIEGRFPDDILETIANAVPKSQRKTIGGTPVLHRGSVWLARKAALIVVAENRSDLEAALEDRVVFPSLDERAMLALYTSPQADEPMGRALAQAFDAQSDWESIHLSSRPDASSLRILATSDQAVERMLDTARNALESIRPGSASSGHGALDRLGVEAEGGAVSLRFAGPLEELEGLLQRLLGQGQSAGHHH